MLSERTLIEEILAPLARPDDGSLGLADDAAFIPARPGFDLVLTQDTLIGGVHFRPQDPADLVARKALRVNLSDLAAKGGEAHAYLLSLGLPDGTGRSFVEAFARGLKADQKEFAIALYGGDTVRAPERMVITVTVTGFVPSGTMVHRSGARPGDVVYVSGTIGDGTLGLAALEGELDGIAGLDTAGRDWLADRFLVPQPRTTLAGAVRTHASAAMDVSDGLVGDLSLMCAASGVGARIDAAEVPHSAPAAIAIAATPGLRERALTGGDDYEILCTVPAASAAAFEAAAEAVAVPVTAIGEIIDGASPPQFFGADGVVMRFAKRSYSHF